MLTDQAVATWLIRQMLTLWVFACCIFGIHCISFERKFTCQTRKCQAHGFARQIQNKYSRTCRESGSGQCFMETIREHNLCTTTFTFYKNTTLILLFLDKHLWTRSSLCSLEVTFQSKKSMLKRLLYSAFLLKSRLSTPFRAHRGDSLTLNRYSQRNLALVFT